MPIPWNTDFTTLDDTQIGQVVNDPAVIGMFIAAINERIALSCPARATVAPFNPSPLEPPSRPAYPAKSATVAFIWRNLLLYTWNLSAIFVRNADNPGHFIAAWDQAYIGTNPDTLRPSVENTVQPPPGGLVRQYPREIWTMAYPGEEGQIARYVWMNNRRWYGANHDAANFASLVTSPFDEKKYGGKHFQFTAGAWVEVSSAGDVDRLSELTDLAVMRNLVYDDNPGGHSAFERLGFAGLVPGDYITGAFLNAIRDALNLFVTASWGYFARYGDLPSGWPVPRWIDQDLSGNAIISAVNADGSTLFDGSGHRVYRYARPYVNAFTPTIPTDPMGGKIPNPLMQQRKIEVWTHTQTGLADVWVKRHDFGTTAAETFFEFDLDTIGGVPTFHETTFLLHGDVPGGFQYTADTE